MNWQQFKALIWLRYRLFMVQFRKMNVGTKILLGLLAAFVAFSTIGGGISALAGTVMLMPVDKPFVILMVCDGIVALFLLAWISGFITELQRSEPISIEKLLHLPMSVRGAFLLNYLSSFASLTVVSLLPLMIGVCIGLPFVYGWKTFIAIPLLIGFLLAITALTYQVRGWLARMMSNPRRRRAVMAGFLVAFIGLSQLPGIIATLYDDDNKTKRPPKPPVAAEVKEPGAPSAQVQPSPTDSASSNPDAIENPTSQQVEAELTEEERKELEEQRKKRVEERTAARRARRAAKREQAKQTLLAANRYFPGGWFPLGVMRAAEGSLLPGLLGLSGLLAIAATSLGMSYRATLNFYRGKSKRGGKSKGKKQPRRMKNRKQRRLVWVVRSL